MYQIKRDERAFGAVIRQNCFCLKGMEPLEYLTFPLLEQTGLVKQLFSTRTGGVSQGIYATMSLTYSRGDNPAHVAENYRRIGAVLGIKPSEMVASRQTHTTNIRRVTNADKGKGIVHPADYQDVDGLITDERGLALVTSYADCVPLYFVDTERKAIGLAHAGWRGTVKQMGACMVRAMQESFGSRQKNILAAIGPSICRECYEVDETVAEKFRTMLKQLKNTKELSSELAVRTGYGKMGQLPAVLSQGKEEGKYQLDLWLANYLILRNAGIEPQNIEVTDVCTCHNADYLFSHRASMGQRGNLSAFLMLKKENT